MCVGLGDVLGIGLWERFIMMVYGFLCAICHFSFHDLVFSIIFDLTISIYVVDEVMGLSKAHHELCLLRAAVFVHARFS